jgi:hypothetical protein
MWVQAFGRQMVQGVRARFGKREFATGDAGKVVYAVGYAGCIASSAFACAKVTYDLEKTRLEARHATLSAGLMGAAYGVAWGWAWPLVVPPALVWAGGFATWNTVRRRYE